MTDSLSNLVVETKWLRQPSAWFGVNPYIKGRECSSYFIYGFKKQFWLLSRFGVQEFSHQKSNGQSWKSKRYSTDQINKFQKSNEQGNDSKLWIIVLVILPAGLNTVLRVLSFKMSSAGSFAVPFRVLSRQEIMCFVRIGNSEIRNKFQATSRKQDLGSSQGFFYFRRALPSFFVRVPRMSVTFVLFNFPEFS